MPRNKKQTIHNLNVNQNIASMNKKKRQMIRAAIFECERKFQIDPTSEEYLILYNRTLGRVNHIKRIHPKIGNILQKQLKLIKPQNIL